MRRPDVKQLLEALSSQKPDDLSSWLPAYAQSDAPGWKCSASVGVPLKRTRTHLILTSTANRKSMVDWRYNIFDAERNVLEASKEALRKSQEKVQVRVHRTDSRLHSFLPRIIIKAIQNERVKEEDTVKVVTEPPIRSTYNPTIQSFDAAVVFMDASGFTSLTEKLAMQANGAEEIGLCLNNFFSPLIKIIGLFGGDILKFSGDALTILWPVKYQPGDSSERGSPPAEEEEGDVEEEAEDEDWSPNVLSAVAAACRCCLEVQARVGDFGKTPIEGLALTLHIGVSFGPLKLLQLGGLMNRWEYCAVGSPLEEVAVAEPLAKSGETVVSPSVVQALTAAGAQGIFKLKEVSGTPGYNNLLGEAKVAEDAKVTKDVPVVHVPSPTSCLGSSLPGQVSDNSPSSDRKKGNTCSELDLQFVERYVSKTIVKMVKGGRMSDEMRRASIVFLSITGIDAGKDEETSKRLQLIVRLLQRSIFALEGTLNKILMDDKGILVLACFGLPPLNHYTDDPVRAVLAAARFCDTLREESLIGRAGIATGRCWCGFMGSELRREYTVLGDVVNLSARLMANAQENKVLVDSATWSACQSTLIFAALEKITVKGKAKPLPVYQFLDGLAPKSVHKTLDSALMNWENWPAKGQVYRALQEQIERTEGRSGVVFVKGGPGSGKTELSAYIRTWALGQGFSLLSGQNIDSTATFAVQHQCWVEVFQQLVASAITDPYWLERLEMDGVPLDLTDSSSVLRNLLVTMLQDAGADEDLMSWLPLMCTVLSNLDFRAREVQAMLERDEQHSNQRSRLGELCEKLLDAYTKFGSSTSGTLVLVHLKSSTSFYQSDDEHSARIMRAVAGLCTRKRNDGDAKPLIFCLISREDILPDESLTTEAYSCSGYVEIKDLSFSETRQFLENSLNNSDLASELVDYIYRSAGGNPFAIKAICDSMREQGALREIAGVSNLAQEWRDSARLHKELHYPETMVGVALAQFEKLGPEQQHILKIASVFVDETSEDFNSSFSALDLSESQGLPHSHAARIEKHLFNLTSEGIFKQVSGSLRNSLASGSLRNSRVSSVRSDDSPKSAVFDEDDVEDNTFFSFKSQLLRHVASELVLRAQAESIVNSMASSRHTARKMSRTLNAPFTGLMPTLSGAMSASSLVA